MKKQFSMLFVALFAVVSFTFANNGQPENTAPENSEFVSVAKLNTVMIEGLASSIKDNTVRCRATGDKLTCVQIAQGYGDVKVLYIYGEEGFPVMKYQVVNYELTQAATSRGEMVQVHFEPFVPATNVLQSTAILSPATN